MTLDELRQLDFKEMPNWPLKAQLGTMVVFILLILGAAYYALYSDMLDEIEREKNRENELRQTFLSKAQQVANLASLEAQLAEIEKSFGAMLKQLPSKAEMDALLTEINQAGIGRGLQFDLFRPGRETINDQLAEMPIQILLTGNYHDLAAFVTDASKLSRIVTIGEISLNPTGQPAQRDEQRLTLQATAKTYRALDPQEKMPQPAPPK